MLKITVNDEGKAVRVKLEGKLTGLWVTELEHCCRTLPPSVPRKQLLFDLTDLDFVDAAGKYLLALMHARGGEFVANTLTMQELVDEITRHPHLDCN